MRWIRSARGVVMFGIAGALAGGLAGVAALSIGAAAIAQSTAGPGAVLDVSHSPALLRTPGEAGQLVYEAHCAPAGVEDPETGCTISATVFARAAGARSFRELPLAQPDAGGARLVASLPDDLRTAKAFEYFAVVTSPDARATVIVPAGGAAAPTVSRRLDRAVRIELGRHSFGSGTTGERVARAPWGDGPLEVGLEEGRTTGPIGASAFDVDAAGSVVVLDHANRKLLRWPQGSARPERIPVSVNGTIADLATADDGSIYVLETTSRGERNPVVRRFDDGGRELDAIETAERSPAQIRMGPEGPLVLHRPSNQWMPALVSGVPASVPAQRSRGRDGRRVRSGAEVVLQRTGNELRLALLAGDSITRSWRITSETPLGEVQLAEPVGTRFVVVVRVYTDAAAEFAVLVLDRDGLRRRATVAAAEWAEGAPLGRFRLSGTDLFRLGTSPAGVFVDRFDTEVR